MANLDRIRDYLRELATIGATPEGGVTRLARSADRLGYASHPMRSAAGHDVRILASVVESGMIFVPSRGGVSHSPDERTDPEDLRAGCEVLLETVLDIDKL